MEGIYKLNEIEMNSLIVDYNEGVLSIGDLKAKYNIACGTLYAYVNMKGASKKVEKIVINIGERYGSLTAISKSPDGFKNGRIVRYYKCRCDCGEERDFTTSFLMKSKKKNITCGCYTWNKKPFGEGVLTVLYGRYRYGAKKRNIKFSITKDLFRGMTKGKCCYCGREPFTHSEQRGQNGGYTYNGIDRVDNDKGYVIGNVVSCCKTCNFSKRSMGFDEFKTWVKAISENKEENKVINYINYETMVGKSEKASINSWCSEYRRGAKRRGLDFNLSRDLFTSLTKSNCYYCNSEPKIIHSKDRSSKRPEYYYNGIDRKDNKIGYEESNLVPCCTNCNLGKGSRDELEFISWAKKVNSNINCNG
jgi:hypothetical protein